MPPRCWRGCAGMGGSKSPPRAPMRRSITWEITACTPRSTAAPSPAPEWSCCTMPCSTISSWANSVRRSMWTSSSTTTASGIARSAWGGGLRSCAHPRPARAAARARGVVGHNPGAAAAVREHAGGARVVEIPHLFAPPPLPGEARVLRYRAGLGVEPATFLFGVFGYLRESKRVAAVLEAFATVRAQVPQAGLLIAGQFVSTDLERAVAPMLAAPGVVRLPYLGEREFWLAARAVDACINLRYPAAGESSGIAVRMMGIGKPVLLTEASESASFPEDACLRIAAGPAERDSLRHHMVLLTSMAEVARAIGLRGAGHIAAHHRVEQIGKRYWDLLCESCI